MRSSPSFARLKLFRLNGKVNAPMFLRFDEKNEGEMSARHFDRHRVRAVRRAAEISQAEVAAAVGVADSTIAGWESGDTVPDAEKLPALARALKRGLDELFPRNGLPDLTDLRCDAGYYQYETAALIGTKSAGPVAGAERGDRRLKDKYVPDLAVAYGVSEEELRRAEDRSIAKAQETQGGANPQRMQGPSRPPQGRPARWPRRSL
ncbi:hypothetical protein GCM10020295_37270 [Streptomyces cinereospinus]